MTCDPTATGTRLRYHQSGCDDSPRWRRFYRLTPEGKKMLAAQRDHWREFVDAIARITGAEHA